MKIPLIEGRFFNDGDTADSPPVVVVDQFLANKYFAKRSALGQQIQRGGPDSPRLTIVGVAGTINSIDLGLPVTKERVYRPATQQAPAAMALVLKTGLDPQTLIGQVRGAVRSIDPEQPIADVRTMDQWVFRSLELRRTPAMLLALVGSVALVLSAIGIYGVLAFSVAQRGREFGIRQALGADRKSILTLVLKQGLMTAGVGIVLGLIASAAVSRLMQTMLFGVGRHDPAVFVGVTAVLFAVAVAACYIPARRATRVDPMVALRDA
jgi:predicted permease